MTAIKRQSHIADKTLHLALCTELNGAREVLINLEQVGDAATDDILLVEGVGAVPDRYMRVRHGHFEMSTELYKILSESVYLPYMDNIYRAVERYKKQKKTAPGATGTVK